jgi:hypothetical protein
MKFSANETVFFYETVNGLAQKIELSISLDKPCGGLSVTIDAGTKGSMETVFYGLEPGTHTLHCHAPVVYPNLVDGIHRPVGAKIAVDTGDARETGMLALGRFRPWTIDVLQDICTDFTWGMQDEQTKLESFRMLKACLDEMDRTDDWADDNRNRYNLNQTVEVEWFLQQASETDKDRFLRRVKEGRLKLSATYNANLSALMPVEQAIRSLYYARKLEREYGISFDTVEHIEMPSMAWGMMQVYAGSGIKRFAKNWLDFNSHYLKKSMEVPLFAWKTPDGGKVLSLMPRGANLKCGYAQAEFLYKKSFTDAMDSLHDWWIPYYEGVGDYPYDHFPLLGCYGDLHVVSKTEPRLLTEAIRRYNDQPWAYPRLVNATWDMYFDAASRSAERLGVEIPSFGGDYGCSWEDWPIHYAHVATKMKRGITEIFAMERLDAAATAFSGKTDPARKTIMDAASDSMQKLAEHPWNGTNDDERWYSYEKRSGWADSLEKCGGDLLALLAGGDGAEFAFNPLCKPRTDIAWLDGIHQMEGAQWVPAMGKTAVPMETGALGLYPVLAKKCGDTCAAGKSDNGGGWLENSFIRVETDPAAGGIACFIDRKAGRDWAKGKGLNSLLYLSDGVPQKTSCVSVEVVANGPVVAALTVRSVAPRCEVETTLWICAADNRLRIWNRLVKEPSGEPLNLYFAFPFDAPGRKYHFESAASILRPGTIGRGGDFLPGAGQEAYAVQDFIDIQDNGAGIILSPLDNQIFQLGSNTYDLMPDGPPDGDATVLALCLTNHAYQEIVRNQYGHSDFRFRFELMPYEGAYDAARAVRFGREANNRLILLSPGRGLRDRVGKPFVQSLTDGIFLTALKPAEEVDGAVVLRFWNTGDGNGEAAFDVAALGMSGAETVDLLERRNGHILSFDGRTLRVPAKGRGFVAVLLQK